MKHLKLHHNYSSLKMKYQLEEYPLLSSSRQLSDGFGHMVEKEDEEEQPTNHDTEDASQLESKNSRIAELEAQLLIKMI